MAEFSPVDQLLVDNEKYLKAFTNSRLLKLIKAPSIEDPAVREKLLDCQQIWSDAFQDLLHLQVAMTLDPEHKKVALEHLLEEFGHNNNLRSQRESIESPVSDELFESTMDWFKHQMLYKSDMARTVLMHVVLEGSGEIWHREATRVFADMPHFQEHGEHDGDHVTMGMDLLKDASTSEIQELRVILDEGWKMITLLCDRIAEIAVANAAVH